MSTTFVVIWCIVGFLITSIWTASEEEIGYKLLDMLKCLFFGWILGPIILVCYIGLLSTLLEKPFRIVGNFFRGLLK